MAANATEAPMPQPNEVDLIDITEMVMSYLYPNNPLNIYLHQLVVYAMSVEQLISVRDRLMAFKSQGLLDGAAGALDLINNVIAIKKGPDPSQLESHAICTMLS